MTTSVSAPSTLHFPLMAGRPRSLQGILTPSIHECVTINPCRRHLLVSTDSARVLIMRTADWTPSRSLFATTEQFHNPVATW